ncbi:DUF6702 family protein [Bacteroidota bacterium]
MRNKWLYILILLLIPLQTEGHPVHVSVINLDFRGKELHVRIQTFIDDWETAYFHYNGDTINLSSPEHYNGRWFNDYFHQSFKIGSHENKLFTEFIRDTIYFQELSMTMELHIRLESVPKTLYIYNAILTDIFADQTNLLIYSLNGKEKGIKFDYKKKHEELKLR